MDDGPKKHKNIKIKKSKIHKCATFENSFPIEIAKLGSKCEFD